MSCQNWAIGWYELFLYAILCSSIKYPYSPTERIGISRGWAGEGESVSAKRFNMKLNWNFQKSIPSMGRYEYFLEVHITYIVVYKLHVYISRKINIIAGNLNNILCLFTIQQWCTHDHLNC